MSVEDAFAKLTAFCEESCKTIKYVAAVVSRMPHPITKEALESAFGSAEGEILDFIRRSQFKDPNTTITQTSAESTLEVPVQASATGRVTASGVVQGIDAFS